MSVVLPTRTSVVDVAEPHAFSQGLWPCARLGNSCPLPRDGHVFCDDWEQASHNGDLVHAVEAGVLSRDDMTQLGDVLARAAEGRESEEDITVFDSTGLAIQDLAIALPAMERADELQLPAIDL
jgi:ornithine cyclodeaminase/alanine dehydrogenase-like protein (mu-crystallin family)